MTSWPPPVQKLIAIFGGLSLLVLLILAGCIPAEPLPTPTPTRTPILPTATPTPTVTPSATPTPTPTLPPGLMLPPTPTQPEAWAALPADLYFLRDGRLWLWPAGGGSLRQLPVAESIRADEAILDYRLAPDAPHLLYVTDRGALYRFNPETGAHTHIPTSGRLLNGDRAHLAITPDGGTLLYIAWDVYPTEEYALGPLTLPPATFGTLLSLNLLAPLEVQRHLGFCAGNLARPCGGLSLSPEGDLLVYADQQGLWRIALTPGADATPELLAPHPEDGKWQLQGWTGDNRWLWVTRAPALAGIATHAMLHVATGAFTELPHTDCAPECYLSLDLGYQGLWLAEDRTPGGAYGGGCLYQLLPDSAGAFQVAQRLCHANAWTLHPTAPHILPSGWPAFAHTGCGERCPGPAMGIYFLGPEEALRAVALLPTPPAQVLWVETGTAFLTFDAEGAPVYLGALESGGLWKVGDLLTRGNRFQWRTPPPRQP